MINLLPDIWYHIAQFLPPNTLQDLFSLNRTFFDLVMDERYRKLHFYRLDANMVKTLDCLRDRAVARRVRSLYFHPSLVERSMIEGAQRKKRRSWPTKLWNLINKKRSPFSIRSDIQPISFKIIENMQSSNNLIRALMDIVDGLCNVSEFIVDWDYSIGKQASVPFFKAAWPIFGSNLRKLVLNISLSRLRQLFTQSRNVTLGCLETLQVTLSRDLPFTTNDGSYSVLVDILSPFIRSVSATLEYLGIAAYHHINFSAFFRSIGHLPHLNQLGVAIPFDKPCLTDIPSLRHFLITHSNTIEQLKLRSNPCIPEDCECTSNPDSSWGRSCLAGIQFNRLRKLEVAFRLLCDDHTQAIPSLHQYTNSLTSLSVTHYTLTFIEFKALVSGFALRKSLTDLTLDILILSPQVFDVLAEQLPLLKKLEIIIAGVAASNSNEAGMDPYAEQRVGSFYDEMRKRYYGEWGLLHLGIFRNSLLDVEASHMRVIAQCFPTLRSVAEASRVAGGQEDYW